MKASETTAKFLSSIRLVLTYLAHKDFRSLTIVMASYDIPSEKEERSTSNLEFTGKPINISGQGKQD